MALRKILSMKDPALRTASRTVTEFDFRLSQLLDDMKETLIKADGAGLAANQIGVLKKVCIIMADDEYYEFVNPVITTKSKKMITGWEGCLSVLDTQGEIINEQIERHQSVTVEAQDRTGKIFSVTLKGMLARAAQHEIDHLSGILYIDYIKKGKNK